jgi:hypothetical protein
MKKTAQSEPSTEISSPRLPHYVRFRDLSAAGIVNNREQLRILMDEHGFPVGVQLSPNIRAWDIEEVRRWLGASDPARRRAGQTDVYLPIRRSRPVGRTDPAGHRASPE